MKMKSTADRQDNPNINNKPPNLENNAMTTPMKSETREIRLKEAETLPCPEY